MILSAYTLQHVIGVLSVFLISSHKYFKLLFYDYPVFLNLCSTNFRLAAVVKSVDMAGTNKYLLHQKRLLEYNKLSFDYDQSWIFKSHRCLCHSYMWANFESNYPKLAFFKSNMSRKWAGSLDNTPCIKSQSLNLPPDF